MTTSLALGCDCLGEITYLDAAMYDTAGEPRTIKNAICIHEETTGSCVDPHVPDQGGGRRDPRRRADLRLTAFKCEQRHLPMMQPAQARSRPRRSLLNDVVGCWAENHQVVDNRRQEDHPAKDLRFERIVSAFERPARRSG